MCMFFIVVSLCSVCLFIPINQSDQSHKPGNVLLKNGRVWWIKFYFECKHTDVA